ncbi:dTDP-4-dehydrorhamnose reductase [Actinoplanes sp. NPDC048791]|uniref:dTDP-4-dehydrorhamnose reductase n=1 Tax=Actinoplanes sp. NPDC048791 TaxID=3154623 RepID=UPI0033CDA8E2
MRWLVTGASGLVGSDVAAVLRHTGRRNDEFSFVTRCELDITDAAAVRAAVAGHDLVINAAAWTDVDGAESNEDRATRVNGMAVELLANACVQVGARLFHLSTDYVFAGNARTPYAEDAPTGPINAYGRSKLAGERAVLSALPDTGYVVRTAWLYGAHRDNFVTKMLDLAEAGRTAEVVTDQIGQPTWSFSFANGLVALARAAAHGEVPAGIYHVTAAGQTSWYGFARAILALSGYEPSLIRPIGSDRRRRPARRPAFSVLGHSRWQSTGLWPMIGWDDMLREAMTSSYLRIPANPS